MKLPVSWRDLRGCVGAWAILLSAVAAASPAAFARQLAREVVLLARVKAHVREALSRLPNYTCLETMERYSRASSKDPLKLVDTVRMEVLYTGGAELYAAQGANPIQHADPTAFTGSGGLMATGVFALHLKAVFLNENAQLTWRGEEQLDGRRAVRWDFAVSRFESGLTIQAAGGGAAGIKGSVWIDPETLDVFRLEDHAYDIPPFLQLRDASTLVNYARMRVGNDLVMLPQEGVISVLSASARAPAGASQGLQPAGVEDRNIFAYTRCRAFQAQSTIRYDSTQTDPQPGAARNADEPASLPAGLEIPILLDAPVNGTAAVGDPIVGKVASDVVKSGKTLIPKGAVAPGRIRRLEKATEGAPYFTVGLEFTELQAGSARFRFYADLTRTDDMAQLDRPRPTGASSAIGQAERMKLPGVGSFIVQGDTLLLPAGFKTIWKTRSPTEGPVKSTREVPKPSAPRRGLIP